jgi:hypothetical protein
VLHYGLIYHVGGWTFDKHFYFDFDSHKCPPWDLAADRPKGGIFPPPPGPKQLERKVGCFALRLRGFAHQASASSLPVWP